MTNRLEVGNPPVTDQTNILEIKVPDQMKEPISTGLVHMDLLCAGKGMLASTVLLITGMPSAGKSTLSLQLANAITKTGNIALYNSCEESLYQIGRTVARLKIKHGFIPSYETDVDDLIAKAERIQEANPDKKVFLFQDSLQTLSVKREKGTRGRGPSMLTQAVEATWRITAWAKKTYGIAIVIGQVTKDGTFAGKQEIRHAVDCHLHLSKEKDRLSDFYGQRIAEMEKNRFGVSNIYYPYALLEEEGFKFEGHKK